MKSLIHDYSNNVRDPVTKCSRGNDGKTVYYKYTPPFNGLMIVDTFGSVETNAGNIFDTIIGVFTGNCNNLTQDYCADQNFTDVVYYPITAGVTYTIKVGEYRNGIGGGRVNITVSFQRNYFNVINEASRVNIGVLNDLFNGQAQVNFQPNRIAYAQLNSTDLSIEAVITKPNRAKSVRLTLDNNKQRSICDNDARYKMYGEGGNNNVPFVVGNNQVITATAYEQANCKGNVIDSISETFFVQGCAFVHYALYDARRDRYLANLYNGSAISSPPCKSNIRVSFRCGFTPDNVRFELRKSSNKALVASRTELNAPYFLFGDKLGDILPGSIPAGEYILTAIINNIVQPSVQFTIGTCNPRPTVDTTFDIDLLFSDFGLPQDPRLTYEITKMFTPIVKRISSLVIGDRPDVTVRITAMHKVLYEHLSLIIFLLDFSPGF
jgi:hypothetical protein